MSTLRLIYFLLFIGFSSSVALAGQLPDTTIKHDGDSHFAAETRLFLNTQLNDTKGIVEARCYFKTGLDKNYLYVSMDKMSENTYQCSLPAFQIGSQTLEYFFLIVNGNRQVIRSTSYFITEADSNNVSQEQTTAASLTFLYVHSELGRIEKTDTSIVDSQMDLVPTQSLDQLYGLRAGIYEPDVIPDSLNGMSGYFGGFIFDRLHNAIRPVKGFAPNLMPPLNSTSPAETHQNNTAPQLNSTVALDVNGNDWRGYFVRTDRHVKEYLTATVVQIGSSITIETTLTGLGHFLAGTIWSNGDMLLYDDYDGEDWTTHYGPATSTAINIYDYVWAPSEGDPSPPLNSIILYRPPQPPSGVQASDGLFEDEILVTWDQSSEASYYIVYECGSLLTSSCTSLAQVRTNQYVDARQVSGKIDFRIRACNTYGCGEFSDYDTGYYKLISIVPVINLLLLSSP